MGGCPSDSGGLVAVDIDALSAVAPAAAAVGSGGTLEGVLPTGGAARHRGTHDAPFSRAVRVVTDAPLGGALMRARPGNPDVRLELGLLRGSFFRREAKHVDALRANARPVPSAPPPNARSCIVSNGELPRNQVALNSPGDILCIVCGRGIAAAATRGHVDTELSPGHRSEAPAAGVRAATRSDACGVVPAAGQQQATWSGEHAVPSPHPPAQDGDDLPVALHNTGRVDGGHQPGTGGSECGGARGLRHSSQPPLPTCCRQSLARIDDIMRRPFDLTLTAGRKLGGEPTYRLHALSSSRQQTTAESSHAAAASERRHAPAASSLSATAKLFRKAARSTASQADATRELAVGLNIKTFPEHAPNEWRTGAVLCLLAFALGPLALIAAAGGGIFANRRAVRLARALALVHCLLLTCWWRMYVGL